MVNIITVLDGQDGWMPLTIDSKVDWDDQVGWWDGDKWDWANACDTSAVELVEYYKYTHFRKMNPPAKPNAIRELMK